MSLPSTRAEFQDYCLRALGAPVINIDLSAQQIDDRIDEALLYWQDFSSDGTERQLYKYILQPADFVNEYITLPDNIIGTIRIFNPGDAFNSTNIFNIRYQIALNDLYTLTSVSMVPYYMAFQHIELLEQILVGEKPIRCNRITNRLYIDWDWTTMMPGMFVIVDCYQVLDPAQFPRLWSDRMLARYATALIKKNWGVTLSKFNGIQILGGITFNGQQIYNEAVQEIDEVEKKIRSEYEMGPEIFIG